MQALRYNPSLMPDAIRSDIPARLDRLPWSRFHWLVVTALGVTWSSVDLPSDSLDHAIDALGQYGEQVIRAR